MKPLRPEDIRGNWATMLLPIGPGDYIDYELLEAEVEYFGQVGVSGVYSNGTAGEFYTQTEEEFAEVSNVLARACSRVQIPFQIGASHMSPQISLSRLRATKALEPSAFQVILPDWFPPSMDDVHRFLDLMEKEARPIPLVLYNPPHAKRRLTPEEWNEVIARHPRIVGIKVPGGDSSWYAAMKPVLEKVSVFIPGHNLATGLSRGARGAYSNVACLSPRGAQMWYQLCLTDPEEGMKLEKRINAFFSEHIIPLITVRGLSNMAADKTMAVAGGWLPGLTTRLRWPYVGLGDEEAARIGLAARKALPELFA